MVNLIEFIQTSKTNIKLFFNKYKYKFSLSQIRSDCKQKTVGFSNATHKIFESSSERRA